MTAAEICENCGREYARPIDGWDWSPSCSIQCNGASRFREGGWTITQALQDAHPDVVVRMVRNAADAQEFAEAMKALVQIQIDRIVASGELARGTSAKQSTIP